MRLPPTTPTHPVPQSEEDANGGSTTTHPDGRSISSEETEPQEYEAAKLKEIVEPGSTFRGLRQAKPPGVQVAVATVVEVPETEAVTVELDVAVVDTVALAEALAETVAVKVPVTVADDGTSVVVKVFVGAGVLVLVGGTGVELTVAVKLAVGVPVRAV